MNERGTIYRFGEYDLCPQTRELLHSGKRVDIQERIFNLLTYLVSNSDRAITKQELIASVWEDKPISETVIPRAIMKARRAIGDDDNPPRIIRTIRGYGYRFTVTPTIAPYPDAEPSQRAATGNGDTLGDQPANPTISARVDNWPLQSRGNRWLPYVIITAMLALGIFIGQHLRFTPDDGDQKAAQGTDPGKIQLILSPLASSDEHLKTMTRRVTSLLGTRLSTVPWIHLIHISETDHQSFAGQKVCVLTVALGKSGSEYSMAYSLSVPDIAPIRGTLTDNNPFLSAEKLVTIVTDFTNDLAESEPPPGAATNTIRSIASFSLY